MRNVTESRADRAGDWKTKPFNSLAAEARSIIDEAVKSYGPAHLFAGFSGGKDSIVVADILSEHSQFSGCFHANTGIGIEETREFVRKVCRDRGWPLVEIRAKEDCGQDYEQLVCQHGFPGPAHHYKMYQRLKERPLRALKKRYPRKERILLATGIRRAESRRRMGKQDAITKENRVIWVNPIISWSGPDRDQYIYSRKLPVSRASRLLCMSGECLCGAFARPNEKEEIRLWFPRTAEYLDSLEEKVRAAGWDWPWGTRPTKATDVKPTGPFCYSCEEKNKEG